MNWLWLAAGAIVIGFAATDALWTTLWVDGHAGPLTRHHNSLTRTIIWRLVPRDNHTLLSLTGPVVLVTSVLAWALLLWAGWVLLFSADPRSLLHAHLNTPATVWDRVYFAGYTMFTVGNGDFSPQGPGWELATAVASLSGLFLISLAVTYLLSILEAVVQKRSFASHVNMLGANAEEVLVNSWTGDGFLGLELQIVSLTEQLNMVSEQHVAYPMLHYYHDARQAQSVPRGLAIFAESLFLLMCGVRPEHRLAPAVMHAAQQSVREFLSTLEEAYIDAADEPVPGPDLARLRARGIPTVSDDEFAAVLREREKWRRLMRGFLEGENRAWPRPED